MIKLKIHLTDKSRSFTSERTGKTYTFIVAYLFLPNQPYPEKIEVFAPSTPRPAGDYHVVCTIAVRDNRLQLNLDMDSLVEVSK